MHRKLHTNVDYSMISREKGAILYSFHPNFCPNLSPVSSDISVLGRNNLFFLYMYCADAFYEEGKKSVCEKDTEALLPDRDQVTVVDPFGLLAIGTFGFDPLHFQDGYSVHEEEYSVEEDGEEEEEEEEDEEEEEEVVVVNTPLPVTAAFKREVEREMLKSQQPVMVSVEMEDIRRPFLKDDEERKKEGRKGERTTLADLFYADAVKISVSGEKCTAPEISAGTGKKTGCSTKQARSLAKKLMPWKAEDSRPTTKLHHVHDSLSLS